MERQFVTDSLTLILLSFRVLPANQAPAGSQSFTETSLYVSTHCELGSAVSGY